MNKQKKISMGDRLLITNYKLVGLTKQQCLEILCFYGHEPKIVSKEIDKANKWRKAQ